MWDTVAIIILLGGLEFLLWYFERQRQMRIEEQDTIQQQKQLEVLDGILTELAIANSTEEPPSGDKIG
jgi:hypothetical protein